jgi:protein TonB
MKNLLILVLLGVLFCGILGCAGTKGAEKTQTDETAFTFVNHDTPPQLLGKIEPIYPEAAKAQGIKGRVTLRVELDAAGEVSEISVLKSDSELLNEAAITAVKKVKFKPAQLEGKPIACTVIIPVDFRLQ